MWNLNLICQYFKCKAHVDIFHWNWLLQKQENKFQGNIFNFSGKFCLILAQNRQFDFDFWQSPNKNCKCGNLWQKNKCACYRKQTCFLFWPNWTSQCKTFQQEIDSLYMYTRYFWCMMLKNNPKLPHRPKSPQVIVSTISMNGLISRSHLLLKGNCQY